MFVLYTQDLKLRTLSPEHCERSIEGAMLLQPGKRDVFFVLNNALYDFNSDQMMFTRRDIKFNGLNQQGLCLSETEFLATQGRNIVKHNMETEKEEVVYETETGSTFNDCVLVTAGRYLLVTDNDGLFLVFDTPLA